MQTNLIGFLLLFKKALFYFFMQLSSPPLSVKFEKLNIVGSYRDAILSEFNDLSVDEQNGIFSRDRRLYINYELESVRELAYLVEHSRDKISTPKIFLNIHRLVVNFSLISLKKKRLTQLKRYYQLRMS